MVRAAIVLAALASVSAPAYAQTEIDDLVSTSQTIVNTIKESRFAVSGMSHYAAVGGITPDGFADGYKLTQELVDSYNDAVQRVTDAVYFNSKMMFERKHDDALDNMRSSIDMLSAATQALTQVVQVNEIASEASTAEEKHSLQQYIQTNDVTLTDAKVTAYNNSLDDVETYAQQAAAFLLAANDSYITAATDSEAQNYNNNTYEATVTYTAANDYLNVTWSSGYSHGYVGFFQSDFKTAEDIMGIGQSIYEGNTLN